MDYKLNYKRQNYNFIRKHRSEYMKRRSKYTATLDMTSNGQTTLKNYIYHEQNFER